MNYEYDRHPATGRFLAYDCEIDCQTVCAGLCGEIGPPPDDVPAYAGDLELFGDLATWAWTIIANAGDGDWENETQEWQGAATRWRDAYRASLVRPHQASGGDND